MSVLIPCRNEAAILRRKIRNALRLRFPNPSRCEVLIIDDYSRDGSAAEAREEINAQVSRQDGPTLRWLTNG